MGASLFWKDLNLKTEKKMDLQKFKKIKTNKKLKAKFMSLRRCNQISEK